MTLKKGLLVPLVGLLLGSPSLVAYAQDGSEDQEKDLPQGTIYYWHDDGGQLHATDNLSAVPAQQQSAAKARAGRLPGGEKTTIEKSQSAWEPPPQRIKKKAEPQDDKAYWQEMIQGEKDSKSRAQERLGEIDAEIMRINSIRPPGFHQTLADLNDEKSSLKAEVKRATHELETGIPEKARRAGVPPGWLR